MPGLAADYAERGCVKQLLLLLLLLTHFYPACDGVDLAAHAKARFEGEVLVGRSLMLVELAPWRWAQASGGHWLPIR